MIATVAGFTHLNANAQDAEQTLNLIDGWNAVHLRVTPDGTMASVFHGAPVELVTTWYPEKLKVSSLQDSAAEPWKNSEWRTWLASGLPGAFLSNLHAMESGRADLIKAPVAATIRSRGTPSADRLHWEAQSFNFTGLPADPAKSGDVRRGFRRVRHTPTVAGLQNGRRKLATCFRQFHDQSQ